MLSTRAAAGYPTNGQRTFLRRISGVIGKEIRFVLLLPRDWNRKFVMGGGGGYVGDVQNQAASTLNLGFATAGTDTGHQGDSRRAD